MNKRAQIHYTSEIWALLSSPAVAYFPQGVAPSVSSALGRFTTVFGMGTGGTTSPKPPGSLFTCLDSLYLYHKTQHQPLQVVSLAVL